MKTQIHQKQSFPLAVAFVLALIAIIAPADITFAQPASISSISFQAALNGTNGLPLPNGNYNLTFRFWDGPAPSGNQVGTNILVPNVSVSEGIASTAIPVDPAWFNGQTRYLGIAVNDGQELSPPVLVTSVPYSIVAGALSGDAVTISANHGVAINPERPARGTLDVGGGVVGQAFNLAYPDVNLLTQPYWSLQPDLLEHDDMVIVHRIMDQPAQDQSVYISSHGNVGIKTWYPQAALDVNGTARMTICQITSDRNVKNGLQPASDQDVLAKLAAMPISTWFYTNSPGVRHIGPMAQDFAKAFGVGEDDKHIATVDADGVALAAIQGLNQKLEEKDLQIAKLNGKLENLRKEMDKLSQEIRTQTSWENSGESPVPMASQLRPPITHGKSLL